MLAVLAPGQGSQTPGMLTAWREYPGVESALARLSEAADLDLLAHGTTSDADTIRDTAIAQPLIVGTALCVLDALIAPTDRSSLDVVAGHSVGEIAAVAAAGVLSDEEAMRLVRERGRAMAAAAATTTTGMCAVLGGDRSVVLDVLTRHGLTAANENGAGQIVAAGRVEDLDALEVEGIDGARLRRLEVAGAFHTDHMAPAVATLTTHAATLQPHDPQIRLLSNADGAEVTSGADALSRLVAQISRPVRWDLCMATMMTMGVTGVVELAPAGTLAGLAKRAMPGAEIVALRTPEDLPAARDLIARHALAGAR